MLVINEGFKLTTYPENENKLMDILDAFDVAITDKRYMYNYQISKEPVRLVLECHIRDSEYAEFVDYLRNHFDGWISLVE